MRADIDVMHADRSARPMPRRQAMNKLLQICAAVLVGAALTAGAVPPAEAHKGGDRKEWKHERHEWRGDWRGDRHDWRFRDRGRDDRWEWRHRDHWRGDRHDWRYRNDWRPGGWHRGHWHRGWVGHRHGWWWVVNDRYYHYPTPVYPYPYARPSLILSLPDIVVPF
jgi:hypothetical protein